MNALLVFLWFIIGVGCLTLVDIHPMMAARKRKRYGGLVIIILGPVLAFSIMSVWAWDEIQDRYRQFRAMFKSSRLRQTLFDICESMRR